MAGELARRRVFRPGISDCSRRKKRRALRRTSSGHGGALASESSPLVSGRLWDFLCGQVCQGKSARPQPELLGIVGWLQVLGSDRGIVLPFLEGNGNKREGIGQLIAYGEYSNQ